MARFITSVADISKLPEKAGFEIAVAGKSNVGKSSFINLLANHRGLAKTSSTPGKTRLLNFFEIAGFTFVDLPGYGFARVPDAEKAKWGSLIEAYFASPHKPDHILLLVDIRHLPTPLDLQMLAFMYRFNIGFTVIATKADKLTKTQTPRAIKAIADALSLTPANILTVSALKKQGHDAVLARLRQLTTTTN